MRLRVSGDKREIRQSYLPTLFPRLVSPLVEHGTEGVQEVIDLMDQYYLSKEEWDAIVEMGIGEGMSVEQVLKSIPTATKSAFTRKCVLRVIVAPLRHRLPEEVDSIADAVVRIVDAQIQLVRPSDPVLQAGGWTRQGEKDCSTRRSARSRGGFRKFLRLSRLL